MCLFPGKWIKTTCKTILKVRMHIEHVFSYYYFVGCFNYRTETFILIMVPWGFTHQHNRLIHGNGI